MTLLIVGGDLPDTLTEELQQTGIGRVLHWDGRRTRHRSAPLPREVKAVLVITDAVAHDVLIAVKQRASRTRIPIFYGRRSRSSVRRNVRKILQSSLPENCS